MKQDELNPGSLLKISDAYWKTCTLHAAVKLDIFTIIGSEKLAETEVAKRLQADERATGMLLNALCAMELLKKIDGNYENTLLSTTFLSRNSPRYVGYIIQHHQHLVASWNQLDIAIKTGRPVRTRSLFSDPEVREAFLMGMFNIAMNTAPHVIPQIDLGGRKRLLDLGGGPGTWAIHFCLKYPEMTAAVYDLPGTKPFAVRTIERFGLSERIQFLGGSYLDDPIPGMFDLIWLSQILHGEGPDACSLIIQKAADALSPGGMILIHEFMLENSMDQPLFATLFSLNMLLGTESGQAYSEQQLEGMLTRAGLQNIHRIPIHTPNDSSVIAGYKP
ncbi:methyltransferase [Desulfatirhabdium butyrativorans]|uniref:methyltransferase n=1 Tax=Desulfatirhabdium butyrativorans TaxID=340467 RepID=UPI0004132EA6|nr:methyltransferase [Desulfatirhabdium butyrativorans]